jgi:hypothetical protein
MDTAEVQLNQPPQAHACTSRNRASTPRKDSAMHTLKTNALATWLAHTFAQALAQLRKLISTPTDLRDLDQRVREVGEW